MIFVGHGGHGAQKLIPNGYHLGFRPQDIEAGNQFHSVLGDPPFRIRHQQIDLPGEIGGQHQGFQAIAGREHFEAFAFQYAFGVFTDGLLFIHEQDAWGLGLVCINHRLLLGIESQDNP